MKPPDPGSGPDTGRRQVAAVAVMGDGEAAAGPVIAKGVLIDTSGPSPSSSRARASATIEYSPGGTAVVFQIQVAEGLQSWVTIQLPVAASSSMNL